MFLVRIKLVIMSEEISCRTNIQLAYTFVETPTIRQIAVGFYFFTEYKETLIIVQNFRLQFFD